MKKNINTMNRNDYSYLIESVEESFKNGATWKRLYYCSAWTAETEEFIILKSYRTIVAIYDKESKILYDILRVIYGYTSTSAQHISKFRHMLDIKKSIRVDSLMDSDDSDIYESEEVNNERIQARDRRSSGHARPSRRYAG